MCISAYGRGSRTPAVKEAMRNMNMGCKPSGLYTTRVRVVPTFSAKNKICSQLALALLEVVPCHQSCLWFSCTGFQCAAWGSRGAYFRPLCSLRMMWFCWFKKTVPFSMHLGSLQLSVKWMVILAHSRQHLHVWGHDFLLENDGWKFHIVLILRSTSSLEDTSINWVHNMSEVAKLKEFGTCTGKRMTE